MAAIGKKQNGPVELVVQNASLRDVMEDIVRVDLSHRPFAKAGRVIVIQHEGRRAFAVARGPAGAGKGIIVLDSATRQKLGVGLNQKAQFILSEAGFSDQVIWAWNATNAMPRIAARLGVVSVGLGAIGLFLGVISLVVTFR